MKPADRHFYRHGKSKVYLEPVPNTVAVKYNGAHKEIQKILKSLGDIRDLKSQNLIIVQMAKGVGEADVTSQLKPWLEKGAVDSVSPVLKDKKSGLLQVLTDEITIRFKPELNLKERRAVAKKYGLTNARQNEFVPNQYVVKTPRAIGVSTLHLANEIDAADEVEFATPNFVSEHQR